MLSHVAWLATVGTIAGYTTRPLLLFPSCVIPQQGKSSHMQQQPRVVDHDTPMIMQDRVVQVLLIDSPRGHRISTVERKQWHV